MAVFTCMQVDIPHTRSACGGQKGALDPLEPCGCWEPNPGPLQEEPRALTAELCLQPQLLHFSYNQITVISKETQLSTSLFKHTFHADACLIDTLNP